MGWVGETERRWGGGTKGEGKEEREDGERGSRNGERQRKGRGMGEERGREGR